MIEKPAVSFYKSCSSCSYCFQKSSVCVEKNSFCVISFLLVCSCRRIKCRLSVQFDKHLLLVSKAPVLSKSPKGQYTFIPFKIYKVCQTADMKSLKQITVVALYSFSSQVFLETR